jgi:cytochrome b
MYMDYISYIHKHTSYFLLLWVLVHILSVLIEQFYHKINMAFTMITGYKKQKIDSHLGKPQ